MKFKVSFIGPIKAPAQGRNFEYEVDREITIAEVLHELGYSEEDMRYFAPVLNGERVKMSEKLNNGDELEIFLPIGGG